MKSKITKKSTKNKPEVKPSAKLRNLVEQIDEFFEEYDVLHKEPLVAEGLEHIETFAKSMELQGL